MKPFAWVTDEHRAAMDQILDGFRKLGIHAERYGDGQLIGVRLFGVDGREPGAVCIGYAESAIGSHLRVVTRKADSMGDDGPYAYVSLDLERAVKA